MDSTPAFRHIYGIQVQATQQEFVGWRYGASPLHCAVCAVSTRAIGEYYMVDPGVWMEAWGSPEGFLCVGCLEGLLGRTLCHRDFIDCPINDGVHGSKVIPQSARLRDRLGANVSRPWWRW